MIVIFTRNKSARFNYVCRVLFSIVLDIPFKIYTNIEDFKKCNAPKINYSSEEITDCFQILPDGEIFTEEDLQYRHIHVKKEGSKTYLFANNPSLDFPFDVFSSSFWLVTRYEEYLNASKDKHQRFRASKSLAYKEDFLKNPLINLHAFMLYELLQKKWPSVNRKNKIYNVYPTIDIDNAYAFLNKGIIRTVGSLFIRLVKFKWKELLYQLRVLTGFSSDPYDTYSYLDLVCEKYGKKPKYFFLLGDYGKYDKNLPYDNKEYASLIQKINEKHSVGIHPSYGADNALQLKREILRLEEVISKKIEISRHHYIRIKLPDTYQDLIDNGIQHDYSMGYPTKIGFRASIATPYPFFNLHTNEETALMIHPFFMMDTTLIKYKRIKKEKVTAYLKPIFDEIKEIEGNVGFIFHNESPGGWKHWKNWSTLFEDVMNLSK